MLLRRHQLGHEQPGWRSSMSWQHKTKVDDPPAVTQGKDASRGYRCAQRSNMVRLVAFVLVVGHLVGIFSGCESARPSDKPRLASFEQAGPVRPEIDFKQMVAARTYRGPYRVVAGDVLSLTLPAILQNNGAAPADWSGQNAPYLVRVNRAGAINVPIVGALHVSGLTLAEIEDLLVQAYYPRYVLSPPAVVAKVHDYRKARITVLGAVAQPGIHQCASNEMTVVGALNKAGGIIDEGAAVIHVRHYGQESPAETLALPIKGLNVPFTDIALGDGDTIEVEGLNRQFFSVIGLVNHAGSFEYPPGEEYTLMEALAFAGGLNAVADPQYARVYRQNSDGDIVDATVRISGTNWSSAGNLKIKPGDVVAVEHTERTRLRVMLSEILQIGIGGNVVYRLDANGDN